MKYQKGNIVIITATPEQLEDIIIPGELSGQGTIIQNVVPNVKTDNGIETCYEVIGNHLIPESFLKHPENGDKN